MTTRGGDLEGLTALLDIRCEVDFVLGNGSLTLRECLALQIRSLRDEAGPHGPLALAICALAHPHARAQQAWPNRAVKILVPFAPGGAIDVMARLLSARLQDNLKVPVIVENRGGVGGVLGSDYVAKQPADGYTILFNTNGHAIAPATFKSLPFDPFRDFTPVTQLFSTNLLVVGGHKLPAKNFREFVALAKSKPGALNYGSSGVGNPLHLTMELLKLKAGMDVQMVPFRSDGDILNAMAAGTVDVAVVPLVTGKEHVKSGELHGLGLTAKRPPTGPQGSHFARTP